MITNKTIHIGYEDILFCVIGNLYSFPDGNHFEADEIRIENNENDVKDLLKDKVVGWLEHQSWIELTKEK